jgi:hypothetical protein
MSTTIRSGAGLGTSVPSRTTGTTLDAAATAFGISAAVAILFNTLLAWVKDAYDPLNTFMAHIGGHHWTTHGLTDLVVFFGLGLLLMRRPAGMDGTRLAALLAGSVVLAGGGLGLWFLLF